MCANCFAAVIAECKRYSTDPAWFCSVSLITLMSAFGWIILRQHIGDSFNWQLTWADYKNGFGSIEANFWLGLERMHLLTSSQQYRLRMVVQEELTGLWYSDSTAIVQ